MNVRDLIQMLCDNPNQLVKELISKRTQLCLERDSYDRKITNLNKVIRIAVAVKTRLERNEEEIDALYEELIGPTLSSKHRENEEERELDLSNLYMLTADEPDDTDTNHSSY